MVGDVGLEPTMGTPRVSKTRAYTNSANRPNRLHHLVLEPFYSVTSFATFWGGGYSHPPMYENKLKLSNLVARGRFELPHEWFKAICLTAWLPGNEDYSLKKSSSNCNFNFSFSSLYLPLRAVTFL